jgi:hypothetical protein
MSRKSKAAPVAEQEEVKADVATEQTEDTTTDNQEAQTDEAAQETEAQPETEKSETSEPTDKVVLTVETGGMSVDEAKEVAEQIKQRVEEGKCGDCTLSVDATPASTSEDEPVYVVLKVGKTATTNGTVNIELNFKPSESAWFTTESDKKKRPSFGIHMNTQLGKFGTLRVNEDGTIAYLKHSDYDIRVKKHKDTIVDEFNVVKRNLKEVLSVIKVTVQK